MSERIRSALRLGEAEPPGNVQIIAHFLLCAICSLPVPWVCLLCLATL